MDNDESLGYFSGDEEPQQQVEAPLGRSNAPGAYEDEVPLPPMSRGYYYHADEEDFMPTTTAGRGMLAVPPAQPQKQGSVYVDSSSDDDNVQGGARAGTGPTTPAVRFGRSGSPPPSAVTSSTLSAAGVRSTLTRSLGDYYSNNKNLAPGNGYDGSSGDDNGDDDLHAAALPNSSVNAAARQRVAELTVPKGVSLPLANSQRTANAYEDSSDEEGGEQGGQHDSLASSRESELAGYRDPPPVNLRAGPVSRAAALPQFVVASPPPSAYDDPEEAQTATRFPRMEPPSAVPQNVAPRQASGAIATHRGGANSNQLSSMFSAVGSSRGGTGDSFVSTLSGESGVSTATMHTARSFASNTHGANALEAAQTAPLNSEASTGETPWNSEFQGILDMAEDTEEQKLTKYNSLSSLSKDFVHVAKTFGKIIISELVLPVERRTIKPISVGGQAGGEKYLYHNILYKFAVDWVDIYGSDEFAMKAASLELKALTRFYGVNPKLHVPLVTLIDYRGWRLVAMSVLPIKPHTLIYGSNDGGRTVKASDNVFNEMMRKAAKRLGIKGHWCGLGYRAARHAAEQLGTASQFKAPTTEPEYRALGMQYLHGPCDIEGHLGFDERYYCIDLARVLPPTAPDYQLPQALVGDVGPPKGRKNTFLFQQFRPEFLHRLSKPLSPDAFSQFGGSDNVTEHNAEIVEATVQLFDTIAKFARSLLERYSDSSLREPSVELESTLTEQLHREGINCRYLGRLRAQIQLRTPCGDYLRAVMFSEMVARVGKNCLRHLLRGLRKRMSTLAEDPYRKETLRFLNVVLGWPSRGTHAVVNDDGSDNFFWGTEMRRLLDRSFPGALNDDERGGSFMRLTLPLNRVLVRLGKLSGVRLAHSVRVEIERAFAPAVSKAGIAVCRNAPRLFRLVVPDIAKVSSVVKQLPIVPLAEGNALSIESLRVRRSNRATSSKTADHVDVGSNRLFRLAMSKFEDAIRTVPDNRSILNNYADVLCALVEERSSSIVTPSAYSLRPQELEETAAFARTAIGKYVVAKNALGLLQLAKCLLSNEIWLRWPGEGLGEAAVLEIDGMSSRSSFLSIADSCFEAIDNMVQEEIGNVKRGDDASASSRACLQDLRALAIARRGDIEIRRASLRHDLAAFERAGQRYIQAIRYHLEALEEVSSDRSSLSGSTGTAGLRHTASLSLSSGTPGAHARIKHVASSGMLSAEASSVIEDSDLLFHVVLDDQVSSKQISSLSAVDVASAAQLLLGDNAKNSSTMFEHSLNSQILFEGGRYLTASAVGATLPALDVLERLCLPNCDTAIDSTLFKSIQFDLCEILRVLDLSGSGSHWTSQDLSGLEQLNVLRELRLNNLVGTVSGLEASIPLPATLAVLELSNSEAHFDVEKLLGRLSQAPCHLETFNLSFVNQKVPSSAMIRAFSSPSLAPVRKLMISNWVVSCPLDFLNSPGRNSVLAQLATLDVSDCPLMTDLHMDSLVSASSMSLAELNVSGCSRLSQASLTEFTKLTALNRLQIERCPDFGRAPGAFVTELLLKCRSFEHLHASGSKLAVRHFADISERCGVLKTLDLGSAISDQVLLNALGHAEVGKQDRQQGFGRGLVLRSRDSKREREPFGAVSLDIHGRNITDASISQLAATPAHALSLVRLVLNACAISDSAVVDLLHNCANLSLLDLCECSNISDRPFRKCLPEKLPLGSVAGPPRLHCLRLRGTKLTDKGVAAIARVFPELRDVDFGKCQLITDLNPLVRFGLASQLRTLAIDGCEFVGNDGMVEIVQAAYSLTELDVFGCRKITDGTFGAIAQLVEEDPIYLPALQTIKFGYNKLSGDGYHRLVRNRPRIEVVDRAARERARTSQETSEPSSKAEVGNLSVAPTQTCQKILMYEAKQLAKEVIPFASAHHVGDDLLTWHMNITAENSPYSGALWHIELKFPADFPNSKPSATVLTPLPHPHVIENRVCLDLLSDYDSYFGAGATRFSTAYGIRTIMLQIQAFLLDLSSTESEHKDDEGKDVSFFLQQIPAALAAARKFSCSTCSHTPEHPWPVVVTTTAPQKPPSDKATPRCFHSRDSWKKVTLGLGVNATYHTAPAGNVKSVTTPSLEFLGWRAFIEDGVRHGDKGDEFRHWFPLVLNEAHALRALEILPECVGTIVCKKKAGPDEVPLHALTVVTKMMNSVVVNIMNRDMHASLLALQGYCWLHRWLLLLYRHFPQVRNHIEKTVTEFIDDPESRLKSCVPDVGAFLPLLLVSERRWEEIREVYLEEHLDRNVFWLNRNGGTPKLQSPLADDETEANRPEQTFKASEVGLRLLAFQIYFLREFGSLMLEKSNSSILTSRSDESAHNVYLDRLAAVYDAENGFVPTSVRERLQREIQAIHQMDGWTELYRRIGMPCPPKEQLVLSLRRNVVNSLRKGYHGNNRGRPLARSTKQQPPPEDKDQASWKEQARRGRPPSSGDIRRGEANRKPKGGATCRDFQAGGCLRGDSCKFSHDV